MMVEGKEKMDSMLIKFISCDGGFSSIITRAATHLFVYLVRPPHRLFNHRTKTSLPFSLLFREKGQMYCRMPATIQRRGEGSNNASKIMRKS